VSFSYSRDAAVILQDIRLRARRGEVIALLARAALAKPRW